MNDTHHLTVVEEERKYVPIIGIQAPVSNQTAKPLLWCWLLECGQTYLQKDTTLSPGSRLAKGLGELTRVLTHLRPYLLLCYDHPGLPRTNNDLERTIRAIKTRYRRISGHKNWNTYLTQRAKKGRLVSPLVPGERPE